MGLVRLGLTLGGVRQRSGVILLAVHVGGGAIWRQLRDVQRLWRSELVPLYSPILSFGYA
jgi:hypothetical protein